MHASLSQQGTSYKLLPVVLGEAHGSMIMQTYTAHIPIWGQHTTWPFPMAAQ